jgi:hypothetical protein
MDSETKSWGKMIAATQKIQKQFQSPQNSRRFVHMIVKTLGSACLLLEIRWQKGRQADQMCTCTHCLPTFLPAPSNFRSLTQAIRF